MILITGGAFQGKLDYAFRLLGEAPNRASLAEGEEDPYEYMMERRIVNHFHRYVRRLLEEGAPAGPYIDEMAERNPEVIVIADELGCGIVPVNPADRAYREAAGRAAAAVAGRAERVYRLVCGIAARIK